MIYNQYQKKSRGIIPVILAIIIGIICIIALVGILALVAWLDHLLAGLRGGGEQPFGNSNIGCRLEGPDTAKATSTSQKKFYITAYYAPVKGQIKYEQGSYEAELQMEGGKDTASGITAEKGAIAAPPSYPFGTVIDIPGYGKGVVVDRGCAIQEAGIPSKCPGLANITTKYDHLDLYVGEGDIGRQAMNEWNGKEVEGTIYYFDFVNNSNLKDYVKIICQGNGISGTTSGGLILPFKESDLQSGSKCQPTNFWDCSGGHSYSCKHGGFDYSLANRTQLYAAATGRIVALRQNLAVNQYESRTGGNFITVYITEGKWAGYSYEYHHLYPNSVPKKVGDMVIQGEPLGKVDNNGQSSAPHLHFQVNKYGIKHGPNFNTKSTIDPRGPLGCL